MAAALKQLQRGAATGRGAAAQRAPFTPCASQQQRCGSSSSRQRAASASNTPYGQAVHTLQLQEQRARMISCRAAEAAAATAAPPAAPPAAEAPADVATMDIRVGKIVKCERHPDADSLYVEQIDVGEAEPRTIVSGLVEFVPIEQMQERKVVVLCNLKPRNMRGVKSNGMVLCASSDAHDRVEPLAPPPEATVGERVWFGEDGKGQAAAAEPNRVQKKKLWEAVQPLLKTDAAATATFGGKPMLTSAGPVTTASLTGASIA